MQFQRKTFYVYIITNRSKTLYTAVTNNLERRMWEHKRGIGSEFASKYKIDCLVYFESFDDVRGRDPSREADQGAVAYPEDRFDCVEESCLA